MAQLSFKQGKFEDINLVNLNEGDLGFAVFSDEDNIATDKGTIVLRGPSDKIFKLMPTPGDVNSYNLPLVSTGAFTSPEYRVLSIQGGGTGGTSQDEAQKNLGFTGAVTTIISNSLPINAVVVSDTAGKITSSKISTSELLALEGVRSNIQNQLNEKSSVTIISWEDEDN